jgi:hypothetical protein
MNSFKIPEIFPAEYSYPDVLLDFCFFTANVYTVFGNG